VARTYVNPELFMASLLVKVAGKDTVSMLHANIRPGHTRTPSSSLVAIVRGKD